MISDVGSCITLSHSCREKSVKAIHYPIFPPETEWPPYVSVRKEFLPPGERELWALILEPVQAPTFAKVKGHQRNLSLRRNSLENNGEGGMCCFFPEPAPPHILA